MSAESRAGERNGGVRRVTRRRGARGAAAPAVGGRGRAVAVGVALAAVGTLVIALPDSDARVVSISEDHGPSALDAAGIVVLLAGWLLLARVVWRGRHRASRRTVRASAVATFAGGVILVPAILYDLGVAWVIGAAAMALAQTWVLVDVVRSVDDAATHADRAGVHS